MPLKFFLTLFGSCIGWGLKIKFISLFSVDNFLIIFIPVFLAIILKVTLYDDFRLFLFLIPFLSLFSAIGLNYSVEEGFTKENISNFGRFTVMKGNSVDSHFNIIYKIKEDYSKKLALIESKYRFSMEKNKCGLKLSGTPIYIDFLKPLEDVGHFVDVLVSSKNPFRIFGVKQMENKDFIRVFGADLHTNDLVNMDITPNWMSIYLNSKSCGNVVTRLVTNIQTFLTSQIKLMGEDNERII